MSGDDDSDWTSEDDDSTSGSLLVPGLIPGIPMPPSTMTTKPSVISSVVSIAQQSVAKQSAPSEMDRASTTVQPVQPQILIVYAVKVALASNPLALTNAAASIMYYPGQDIYVLLVYDEQRRPIIMEQLTGIAQVFSPAVKDKKKKAKKKEKEKKYRDLWQIVSPHCYRLFVEAHIKVEKPVKDGDGDDDEDEDVSQDNIKYTRDCTLKDSKNQIWNLTFSTIYQSLRFFCILAICESAAYRKMQMQKQGGPNLSYTLVDFGIGNGKTIQEMQYKHMSKSKKNKKVPQYASIDCQYWYVNANDGYKDFYPEFTLLDDSLVAETEGMTHNGQRVQLRNVLVPHLRRPGVDDAAGDDNADDDLTSTLPDVLCHGKTRVDQDEYLYGHLLSHMKKNGTRLLVIDVPDTTISTKRTTDSDQSISNYLINRFGFGKNGNQNVNKIHALYLVVLMRFLDISKHKQKDVEEPIDKSKDLKKSKSNDDFETVGQQQVGIDMAIRDDNDVNDNDDVKKNISIQDESNEKNDSSGGGDDDNIDGDSDDNDGDGDDNDGDGDDNDDGDGRGDVVVDEVMLVVGDESAQGDVKKLKLQEEIIKKLRQDCKQQAIKLEAANSKYVKMSEEYMKMAEQVIDLEDAKVDLLKTIKKQKKEYKLVKEQDESRDKIIGDLTTKASMCTVFEQGLGEMRKLLDEETALRTQSQEAFDDLFTLQSKYTLTWIPPKLVNKCMNNRCSTEFSMFGSKSRDNCRMCGRVFCSACLNQQKKIVLPTLGYKKPVRVCSSCSAVDDRS